MLPTSSPYFTTSDDRGRFFAACAVTTLSWWLIGSVPITLWALSAETPPSTDTGRFDAAHDVVVQGWWAVTAVALVLTIGAFIAVALERRVGGNWTLTAWKNAVILASAMVVTSMVWAVCVIAAEGSAGS